MLRTSRIGLLAWLLLLMSAACAAGGEALTLEQVRAVLPAAKEITRHDGEVPAYAVRGADGPLGYAFTTRELAPIAAYSGKPVDVLVGVGMDARIQGVSILQHEEPILVIGISEGDLARFVGQFVGKQAADRIQVGAHGRAGYVGIDGISGATITSMVVTNTVTQAAHRVAAAYGLPRTAAATAASVEPAVQAEPAAPAALVNDEPAWHQLWRERTVELVLVSIALVILLLVLFFQDWLVRHTVFFHRMRVAYLLFTVFFIGLYCSAQLSVINVLAFFHALQSGFSWDTLLIEPVIFLLWAFVAVSILLWGRGVYCGWLCPFGAAQDLISKLAKRLGIEGFRLPQPLHERLWAIKYFILIGLVGLSLDSMARAAELAELEPFKTTFVMRFAREPVFVAYAAAMLLISAVNSKFYCKYLCPLGASLSFATRFRIFDWLRRRRECGKPCQSCAQHCQIAAIRPTGEIIDNECHYCLECQVTYWDDHRCPPLVEARKRHEHAYEHKAPNVIASEP